MRENFSFGQVPAAEIQRSTFNRSHGHKTTFDAGYLVPIFVDEALPGDTYNVKASIFARMATPVVPIMDNLVMDIFYFAVPNRLVWDNWQKFCGEQRNPGDSTDFLVPTMTSPAGGFLPGTLADYLGFPTGIPGVQASALFHRAYYRIWNEWFRDENLQTRYEHALNDGPDDISALHGLKRRGKRHDYFTSCLPWPQKGPGALLPLGSSAPIIPTGSGIPEFFSWNIGSNTYASGTAAPQSAVLSRATGLAGALNMTQVNGELGTLKWSDPKLAVDLTNATAATINSLRQAFQIQRLMERDARGGTRYVEILRAHFGVVSPDARLQRSEYLGGGQVAITVNPVTQTSSMTGQPTPQGNLAAYGVAGGSAGFTKSFVEHSIIFGIASVRAELSYQQGLHKMFSRRTRYDFYWPGLAHLGEQAVLTKEIHAAGSLLPGSDDTVFGYQERWAEYRYAPSKITGKFRSTNATPLDVWHLGQKFVTPPALNASFIEENPPVARVLAVPSEPHFLFDSYFNVKCTRPMPTYSVPGMIDHF